MGSSCGLEFAPQKHGTQVDAKFAAHRLTTAVAKSDEGVRGKHFTGHRRPLLAPAARSGLPGHAEAMAWTWGRPKFGPRNYFRKRAASPEARFTGCSFLIDAPSPKITKLPLVRVIAV